jgi:hypothetical protein
LAGKITKGDIELLSNIAEYKFLTVKQLRALSQRRTQSIRRRLRFLAKEGIVAMGERGFGHGPGRRENIIIVTEKGMDLLRDKEVISEHAAYVTDKTPDSMFLDHDLLVNWFFIHLLKVGRDNLLFNTQHLTTSSHSLKEGNADKPVLMERFADGASSDETYTMIPDGVFIITNKESEKSLLFFLEVDMGTETLQSTKLNPRDVRQKIINYQTMFQENQYKRYEKIFNTDLNGFRLLFLANDLVRMKAICHLAQRMSHSDFIWVTDQKQMFSHGVSAEIWARGGRNDRKAESILGPKLAFECFWIKLKQKYGQGVI